jgi:hypothetical protein
MTLHRTEAARKNLRKGIKKMENSMSAAARVRRAFQLGRPPKPLSEGEMIPEPSLRPAVLWQRAVDALASLRARMQAAGLKPEHAEAAIVYVERAAPDEPHVFTLAEDRIRALELFASEDVIPLGMIFMQHDEQTGQRAIFPYLFFGLNQRGMAVLRKAAEREIAAAEMIQRAVN